MRHPPVFRARLELNPCECADDALSLGYARDKLPVTHPPPPPFLDGGRFGLSL